MKQKWKEAEMKKLFKMAEQYIDKNKSMNEIFSAFASENNRKPNSVRNFYYQMLKEMQNNSCLAKRLNADLSKHKVTPAEPFSEKNSKDLYDKINSLVKNGYSVRRACFSLAKGDLNLMVRYQNKFRLMQNSSSDGENKVINFPIRNTQKLTDDEIKSLFMGLVKLVKQSAVDEIQTNLKSEVAFTSDTLRKTLIEMANKNKIIDDLIKSNKELSYKNVELKQKIAELRSINIKNTNPRLFS